MPRTLWNEGRVVGLSAYEIFVRHILGKDPTATVPSEQAWLASMLSNGLSMLLQIGVDNTEGSHYVEIEFPQDSTLWAANTIIGSFFIGSGDTVDNSTTWCTEVLDYGPLINNNSSSSPSGSTIPPTNTDVEMPDYVTDQVNEYAKILDGIVIQPGTWADATSKPPEKSLTPDSAELPKLRILLSDKINTPFYVLLTGFTYKGVLDGVMDYTAFNTHPENGDFLGPVSFPWANKIVFTVPSAAISELQRVNVEVVDLANMYLYNTKYLWAFKNPPGGGVPFVKEDLRNIKSLTGIQVIAGHVSDEFISKYCVSYDDALLAGADGKISSSMQLQLKYVNQLHSIYGADAEDENKWKYFFYYINPVINSSSQDGAFFPVNMQTKQIFITTFAAPPEIGTKKGFNFSGEAFTDTDDVVVYPTSTDIMGTYWSQDPNPGGTTVSQKLTAAGEYVFEDHPIQYLAVTEYELFNQPTAGVPKPPVQYGDDFITWLSVTPIRQVIDPTGTHSDDILNAMDIHSSYRDLDAETFLQYLATGRDMSKSIDTDFTSEVTNYSFYIYDADTIGDIISQSAWSETGYACDATMKASLSVADFFKPAKISIIRASDDADITKQMSDPSYHVWGAETKVNRDNITALSLTDSFGGLLPMNGTQGTVEGDKLTWDMLMTALSQNKSVDLLGSDLREMKNVTNYIPFGNGLRLYVSSTEPVVASGDTIPEGSVGLGWGGVKVYTSGAWV